MVGVQMGSKLYIKVERTNNLNYNIIMDDFLMKNLFRYAMECKFVY